MVITIEPGIYVPPDSSSPKEFHNIGIRIEVRELWLLSVDCSCLQSFSGRSARPERSCSDP